MAQNNYQKQLNSIFSNISLDEYMRCHGNPGHLFISSQKYNQNCSDTTQLFLMLKHTLLILIALSTLQAHTQYYTIISEKYQIDLSASPETRYTQVSRTKKQEILSFIDFLHTQWKYKIAFTFASFVTPLISNYFERQFYLECSSIAKQIGRPISQLIVFNFMYELGAYHDFCTTISIQNNDQFILARNLDYGYQQYLLQNSVIFEYLLNGQMIMKTVGHAGLIGLHTGIRINTHDQNKNYAVSMNQRVSGGLHVTLWHILTGQGQTILYLIMKTLRNYDEPKEAIKYIQGAKTYAPAYFIFSLKNQNILIEKDRNWSQGVFKTKDNYSFLVQTNTDLELPDPDSRRDVANEKVGALAKKRQVSQDKIIEILSEKPNKNQLTLLTVYLNVLKEEILVIGWPPMLDKEND